jgi:hypothetical protein
LPNFTETFSNSGLAPNCMVMLAVEIKELYLSITWGAMVSGDTDLIPFWSFSISLQSELELIHRAYVDSSICTLWPSC